MIRFGSATRDITPDFPGYLHGYAGRARRCAKVEDPIELVVFFLENEGQKLLFVTIDSLGIQEKDCQRLYRQIGECFQIEYPSIMISASHTHFAPNQAPYGMIADDGDEPLGQTCENSRFGQLLEENVLSAVKEAIESAQACSMEFASIPLPSLAFNRRPLRRSDRMVENHFVYPADPAPLMMQPYDDELTVWRFRRDGKTVGILSRFSCHPVTGGLDNEAISGDYPYFFRRECRKLFDAPCAFLQGAAGDIVPIQRRENARENIGRLMAESIQLCERKFRPVQNDKLSATAHSLAVTLRADLNLPVEECMAKFAALAKAPPPHDPGAMQEALQNCFRAQNYVGKNLTIGLQLLTLGDHQLAGIPFEVLSSIGLKLRKNCPGALVISLTGGYHEYLGLAADNVLGGYEPSASVFAADTGDRILQTLIGMIQAKQECNSWE